MVNRNREKKDFARFLQDMENDYVEARGSHDKTNSIEGIERPFVDGMQYVYCYLKDLLANETTRTDTQLSQAAIPFIMLPVPRCLMPSPVIRLLLTNTNKFVEHSSHMLKEPGITSY